MEQGRSMMITLGGLANDKNKKTKMRHNELYHSIYGKLDHVVGRQDQIERVTQILGRRTKNNHCLIGKPSVRKTANAKGLTQRIANGDIPETIKEKKKTNGTLGIECSSWMDWFHGGLQFQVEHNLFPRLSRRQLRKVSPFVKELCKKRGLPYNCASFWKANVIIVRTLKNAAFQAWDFTKPVLRNLV
ncbi:Cold-shock DNA-binding domain [Forsythia ovata]|uniref:Cold-shock DNA-binding domain n=1 Tax=Forsythia ovata TaxID=205694 RepID=A0ABD1T5I3_9LAMI